MASEENSSEFSNLENELQNTLHELNEEDIVNSMSPEEEIEKSSQIQHTKKTSKASKIPIIVIAIIGVFLLYQSVIKRIITPSHTEIAKVAVESNSTNIAKPDRTLQKEQNKTDSSTERDKRVKSELNARNNISIDKQSENVAVVTQTTSQSAPSDTKKQADIERNSTTQQAKQTPDEWKRTLELAFVESPRVMLNFERPIVEVKNMDIFSDREIEFRGYNAIIKPAELRIINDDIYILIEIHKKDEPNIYTQKQFKLSDYGFKPMYFGDSIAYNNDVYLVGDKLLFFVIKDISDVGNGYSITLQFGRQELNIFQEK